MAKTLAEQIADAEAKLAKLKARAAKPDVRVGDVVRVTVKHRGKPDQHITGVVTGFENGHPLVEHTAMLAFPIKSVEVTRRAAVAASQTGPTVAASQTTEAPTNASDDPLAHP